MRILVGISHPKQVHMFKNLIKVMEKQEHTFKVVVIQKEITEYLLDQFNISYELIGKNQPSLLKKIFNLPKWEYRTLKIANKFKPDIFIGQALPHLAHVSTLLNKPFIVFEDTEVARQLHKFVLPFADMVVTPNCYKNDLGKKHVRFDGYFELAYLHPNHFKSNPSVLDDLGINSNDKFVIVRFVAWHAHHDVGQKGLNLELKRKVIKELEKYARVFITSESPLPHEFKKYSLNVSSTKMHDLLHYASMYFGEGGTMASEAGILGTPSIYVSSLADKMGNFEELEDKYKLIQSFKNPNDALEAAINILIDKNSKNVWQKRREKLFNEKIDATKFMQEILLNYYGV